jgi:hypothetical protein
MPAADDFGIKVSRELRPVIRKPSDAEITTQERGREVDILEYHEALI